jgi:uncharacterized protein YkwD
LNHVGSPNRGALEGDISATVPTTVLKRLLITAVVAVLLLPATAVARMSSSQSSLAGMSSSETSLLREMNKARADHGLAPLRVDAHLERAARSHSREMLADNVFTHGAFGTRMLHFDVKANLAGENLAWGTGSYSTPQAVVAGWLGSPEHRANLLRPGFHRVGVGALVGAFQGTSGARVVTADFAG